MTRGSAVVVLCWLVACGPGPGDATGVGTTGTAGASTTSAPTEGVTTSGGSVGGTTSTSGTAGPASTSTGTSEGTSTGDMTTAGPVCPVSELGCRGGQEMFQNGTDGQDAGLEACPNGMIHRHTAVACELPFVIDPCTDGMCMACDVFGGGVCHSQFNGGSCYCKYPCTVDEDCGPGALCLCASSLPDGCGGLSQTGDGSCEFAGCRTDTDCGEFLCALSHGECGQENGFFCHTPADACEGDQDCLDSGQGNLCSFNKDEMRWVCISTIPCE